MKRIIAACLYGLILLMVTGCSIQDNIPEEMSAIIPDNAVISPDGNLAVCSYIKENLEDEDGLLYSIYDVQLYDITKKVMICTFHIVGNDFDFLWSPDSKYITAAYSGKTWSDFSILNVRTHDKISMPAIFDILNSFKNKGEKFDYEINPNRPDSYVLPIEWSPDSTRILVSYQVKDTEYKTQNGFFIYDFLNETFTDLQQLPSTEDDHIDIKKPENFFWN